eukprot:TRINITY_DN6166_c0_g1_i4.p1 TRINITY_DN6166_c0_g1~~TRINITY_DN6166_c0_g1_i4.p1  ORF type:complete len:204 (+),score=54.77 TRINITY_DN6166_c0_g1_i4:273-884(+)
MQILTESGGDMERAMEIMSRELPQPGGAAAAAAAAPSDPAETIAQTMRMMSESAKSLESAGSEADMMAQMMQQFSSMGENPDFQKMMETMMQQLMSKEVLYEPMKDIEQRYPAWLSANKGVVPREEFERYTAQYSIVQKICREFEGAARTEQVVELMEQMQGLGQPPPEIIKDIAPGVEFGPNGAPMMPGMPPGLGDQQCCVM